MKLIPKKKIDPKLPQLFGLGIQNELINSSISSRLTLLIYFISNKSFKIVLYGFLKVFYFDFPKSQN
jgi:hypothetical protein